MSHPVSSSFFSTLFFTPKTPLNGSSKSFLRPSQADKVIPIQYKTKIKREMIESLKEFPKTTNALASDVKVQWKTADNRLQELKEDGVVIKDGNKWRLNSN